MADKLIGKKCPEGPGGRDCACCGQPPGAQRKKARRAMKRRERFEWLRDAWKV